MDSENQLIQPAPEFPAHEEPEASRREYSWGAILGWILIPAGILALLVSAVVYASGEEARQIRAWGQKGDRASLIHVFEGSRNNGMLDASTLENQKLAWSELMRIDSEAKDIDLEVLFYALGVSHPLSPAVLSHIKSGQRPIQNVPRFAETWLGLPDTDGNQAKAIMASIFQAGDSNLWNTTLRALVGRSYGEGHLAASIERARRLAALGLDPANLPLKEALEQSGALQAGISGQQAVIRNLEPKISDVQVELSRMDWPELTAFLVDRVPAIDDNAYEIATFHWNGWEMERDETALLICSERTFTTKGRFTMAVHPTGTKTFSLKNGGSMSLPTFSEVTRAERAQRMEAKLRLDDLKSRRREAEQAIQAAEHQLEDLNHRIKQLLGWEPVPTQV